MPDKQATSVVRELSSAGDIVGSHGNPRHNIQEAEPTAQGVAMAVSSRSAGSSSGVREVGRFSWDVSRLPTSRVQGADRVEAGLQALNTDNHEQCRSGREPVTEGTSNRETQAGVHQHLEEGKAWTPEHLGASREQLLRLGVQGLHEEVVRRLVASLALQFGYRHLDVHLASM
jgi:hypothetical protein